MELLHLKSFDFKLGNTRKTILCHFCANLILKCIKYDYGVVYDYDLWKYDLLLEQEKSFGETEAAFTILSYLHHQDTETSANFVDEFFRKWLRWCILLSSPLLSCLRWFITERRSSYVEVSCLESLETITNLF